MTNIQKAWEAEFCISATFCIFLYSMDVLEYMTAIEQITNCFLATQNFILPMYKAFLSYLRIIFRSKGWVLPLG